MKTNNNSYKSSAIDLRREKELTIEELAEEWMDLCITFQQAPRIRKIELKRNIPYERMSMPVKSAYDLQRRERDLKFAETLLSCFPSF